MYNHLAASAFLLPIWYYVEWNVSCHSIMSYLRIEGDADDSTDKAVLATNGFAADGKNFVKRVKQRLEVGLLLVSHPNAHNVVRSIPRGRHLAVMR